MRDFFLPEIVKFYFSLKNYFMNQNLKPTEAQRLLLEFLNHQDAEDIAKSISRVLKMKNKHYKKKSSKRKDDLFIVKRLKRLIRKL